MNIEINEVAMKIAKYGCSQYRRQCNDNTGTLTEACVKVSSKFF
jgi:hypothetical protein